VSLSIGTRLGPYEIVAPLGAGGMGEVFLAEDTRLERRVAVKLLPASASEDANARERLRREALAAAALDHPFICKVFEIGDADGRFFIVMEYVEGETLHAAARRAALPLRQVIDVAHELAQALDAAHRRGLLHRDLKPANVILTSQGHVKCSPRCCSGTDACSHPRPMTTNDRGGARWSRQRRFMDRINTSNYSLGAVQRQCRPCQRHIC
jgi:serine/threonine protein kinase